MSKIEIRSAKMGDEKVLAHIQTESWKAAFSEIISMEDMMKYTDITVVEKMYANVLLHNIARGAILEVDGLPHCMAFWSKCRDNCNTNFAELICIHSLPNNWRKGYGTIMMKYVLSEMKKDGYNEVMLWVFEKNIPARRFYEKHGFVLTDKRKESYNAAEIMYYQVLSNSEKTIQDF